MAEEPTPQKLTFELDGPGVHPQTVDTAKLLALASSYFDLLQKMGSEDETPIAFHGLEIIDKCVAVRALPNDPENAKRLADASAAYLQGAKPPAGLRAAVQHVREAFLSFPSDHTAKVIVGPWVRELIIPVANLSDNFPMAIETMRATILRVGGSDPKVRLKGSFEKDAFSVDLTQTQAQELAAHLYKFVDVVLRILRTGEGRVAYCELVEFNSVSDQDASKALKDWFRPHAEFWDKVKDISQVLGRDRS